MKLSDMLFANAMMGEGGGGGGGDLKTANLTVILAEGYSNSNVQTKPFYDDQNDYYDCILQTDDGFATYWVVLEEDPSIDMKVIMFGNEAHLYCGSYVSSTGDISYNPQNGEITVSGDGTLTIASAD